MDRCPAGTMSCSHKEINERLVRFNMRKKVVVGKMVEG